MDDAKEKAGELKDEAGEKLNQAGDAIKDGAAKADKAIQDAVGNGSTTPPTPQTDAKP